MRAIGLAVAAMLFSACTLPVTLHTLKAVNVPVGDEESGRAMGAIARVLVDHRFDIKISNEAAGIITTEYKQVASSEGRPPFDFYLQIRVSIREGGRGAVIRVTPSVKEQNRLNAVAFTDHELAYYTGENAHLVDSQKPGGWRSAAQGALMEVVRDIADACGVSSEEIELQETTQAANALGAR